MMKNKESEQEIEADLNKQGPNFYMLLFKKLIQFPIARNFLLEKFKKKAYNETVEKNTIFPRAVQIKKYEIVVATLESVKRNLDKGYISKDAAEKVLQSLLKYNFIQPQLLAGIKENFKKKYGIYPPSFVVLAPTQKCNLKCAGCYASAKANAPTLPYDIVDKIVNELYYEFGSRFMTITGGEPLMYNDSGKTLFDIWAKYPEMFFLFYTNATLITRGVAEKLAELGNVTPAISIEGLEKETDERRGKGVYKKVIEAAKNLREVGVPFGFSVTATSKNFHILMEDQFYDYLFKELGGTYLWMFQLMPIGQACDMGDCMITPEQRVKLFRKWEYLLKEKKYPVVDFWNSGTLTNGCIAYGRRDGYFYIDWNGNITPCAFVPYYKDNVIGLFKKGKKLAEALLSDFFKRGRKWQEEFGYDSEYKNLKKPGNWLAPCSIRDHFLNFKKNILTKNAKPEDKYAEEFMKSEKTSKLLEKFDQELEKLTGPIWEKEFLKDKEED